MPKIQQFYAFQRKKILRKPGLSVEQDVRQEIATRHFGMFKVWEWDTSLYPYRHTFKRDIVFQGDAK